MELKDIYTNRCVKIGVLSTFLTFGGYQANKHFNNQIEQMPLHQNRIEFYNKFNQDNHIDTIEAEFLEGMTKYRNYQREEESKQTEKAAAKTAMGLGLVGLAYALNGKVRTGVSKLTKTKRKLNEKLLHLGTSLTLGIPTGIYFGVEAFNEQLLKYKIPSFKYFLTTPLEATADLIVNTTTLVGWPILDGLGTTIITTACVYYPIKYADNAIHKTLNWLREPNNRIEYKKETN